MLKRDFEDEFRKRFRGTDLVLSSCANSKVYVVSNAGESKALLVRTVVPSDDRKQKYVRHPAPFYNAEADVLFRFKTDDSVFVPDIFTFVWRNTVSDKTDFLIFRTNELKESLEKVPLKPSRAGYYRMLLWIFPHDFVIMASRLSAEGEWYLLGGLGNGNDPSRCIAKDSELDFSMYLNRWIIF